jgi:hypothetical protein
MVENNETLIVDVMLQIYRDMRDGEGDPLFEMLERVPEYILKGYLNEAHRYEKLRYN